MELHAHINVCRGILCIVEVLNLCRQVMVSYHVREVVNLRLMTVVETVYIGEEQVCVCAYYIQNYA